MWPVVIDARQREPAASRQVRIGDAERDQAVSTLGDHFAAGRLTREELDERIDQAMQARFSTDLDPLFDDLPDTATVATRPDPRIRAYRQPSPLLWVLPILVVALVVAAIAAGAPWMFGGLIWVLVLGRFWGGGWNRHHPHAHRSGPPSMRG